jgi:N6-L-threonylcarbamoyladenine synthase
MLSCEVSSSLNLHKKYRGIIPEIASRVQLETINIVVDAAVKDAGINKHDIGLVAVTHDPGLPGSLLIGRCFSRAISFCLGVPLLNINHLYSHIYAAFLNRQKIGFPFIGLVVSGGHTSLFYVRNFSNMELIGSTCDDACGEAFDKVAKILDLGYPGGPYIEKRALKGNSAKFKFACSNTKGALDFSFSGIKTAVLYAARKMQGKLTAGIKDDLAASFQETVIDTLTAKAFLACRMKKVKSLVVGGGVAANSRLKEKFFRQAKSQGIAVFFPQRSLCMDNAAMVAGLGFQLYRKNRSCLIQ